MAEPSLYEDLGVERDASTDDIRKAYRKLSRTHHPDRGGSSERFARINHAHEILTDPEKRRQYDLSGSTEERHAPIVQQQLRVPLQILLRGTTQRKQVRREVKCPACKGHGFPEAVSKDLATSTCRHCRGQGKIIQEFRTPFGTQRQESLCGNCKGRGYSVKAEHACAGCDRSGMKSQIHEFQIEIPRHSLPGSRVVVPRAGPWVEQEQCFADMQFVLVAEDHPDFRVQDGHLVTHRKIHILDQLAGGDVPVRTLDGRDLLVAFGPIREAQVIEVPGEGLSTDGSLIIVTSVEELPGVENLTQFREDLAALLTRYGLWRPRTTTVGLHRAGNVLDVEELSRRHNSEPEMHDMPGMHGIPGMPGIQVAGCQQS